ncbi:MAG: hypothetical protein LKE36_00640 [Bacilli bacterium]|jgi:hypothetical protein|nr:hypothetical protein [Bacilli bacterium]
MIKNTTKLLLLSFIISCLLGCSTISVSEQSPTDNKVDIHFIQLDATNFSTVGGGFGNTILAETILTFEKGQKLTQEEIFGLEDNKVLNYKVPPLINGYFMFTFFYYDRYITNNETQLTPETIISDHEIYYFGIEG